jgi:hypothetical protein
MYTSSIIVVLIIKAKDVPNTINRITSITRVALNYVTKYSEKEKLEEELSTRDLN